MTITNVQFANLQSLFFKINGATYEFTVNTQIWPRSLNTIVGGTSNNITSSLEISEHILGKDLTLSMDVPSLNASTLYTIPSTAVLA